MISDYPASSVGAADVLNCRIEDDCATGLWDRLGMSPKEPKVSGWRPDFQPADEQFRHQATGLRNLAGLRITGAWTVWNLQFDEWFADLPVVIRLDDGRQLEVCWEKFNDLSITWDTIDLAVTPKAWVEWRLEWRTTAHPALLASVGSRIQSVRATTFRFSTQNVDRPREVCKVWLTAGLWLATDSGDFHIFNALDENGLSNERPGRDGEHDWRPL